jgi:hypothetical protein
VSVALVPLRVARHLRDAGLSEVQAEALTDVLRESIASGELVTQAELIKPMFGRWPRRSPPSRW